MPDNEPLLTTRETMQYLNVSRTTLWHMVKTGAIPAYRLGGELRYKKEEIDAYILRNRVSPEEQDDA